MNQDKKNAYIAASWKHKHAVELLTGELRDRGLEVNSFIEKEANFYVNDPLAIEMSFDKWVMSADGKECFEYDVNSAMSADLVIYLGPSGKDAWAEVGAAYARGVPIYALFAKGEDIGLMRRMVSHWFDDVWLLLFDIGLKFGQPKETTPTP
ncbi:hypothetical protein [Leptospira andrefontaineae]|uniref:Nucleoside 2-deoxyribosyltransferase n=1 Tax=Leptospira andrefontaineae TaxID=2484976 RepID=A0A4R9GYJ5_9LEPT|nr:hypothetical protein [Leptospira andrefontaineae]TGK36233.1 hypothetical protein EHO65_18185 [Leptospira andrefontaineae]